MQDIKRDYLIKTLSRTKRKDFENYIINAIWHKLGRDDVMPTTQQYILRSDGKYALVDLFFPQLNIGIECDEEYHISNKALDEIREIKMEEALSAYEETSNFELFRVKAYENLHSINTQIEDIVGKINQRITEVDFIPWDPNIKPYETALEKGFLSVADRLEFSSIVELCKCFGKDYKGMQQSYFHIGNNHQLWCPKLAIEKEGVKYAVSNGWINLLSDDWNSIWETNDDKSKVNIEGHNVYVERPRICFAKSRNALGLNMYRFVGVFKIDKERSNSDGTLFVRISETINLEQFS